MGIFVLSISANIHSTAARNNDQSSNRSISIHFSNLDFIISFQHHSQNSATATETENNSLIIMTHFVARNHDSYSFESEKKTCSIELCFLVWCVCVKSFNFNWFVNAPKSFIFFCFPNEQTPYSIFCCHHCTCIWTSDCDSFWGFDSQAVTNTAVVVAASAVFENVTVHLIDKSAG